MFLVGVSITLWSLVNIADKYLVKSAEEYPIGSLVLFVALSALIFSLSVFAFAQTEVMEFSAVQIAILIVSGTFSIGWIILYLKALQIEETTRVVPWFLLVPVFGYILGYFFLGEDLSWKQIEGGLVICLGGFISSMRKMKIHWKPVIYMIFADLLIAGWSVTFKYVAKDQSFWVSTFWEHLGIVVVGIVIFFIGKKYRDGFLFMLKNRKFFTINMSTEMLTILGNVVQNYAMTIVPLAYVLLGNAFQPAIVFIITLGLARIAPSLIEDDETKPLVVIQKMIAIVVMIVGAKIMFF